MGKLNDRKATVLEMIRQGKPTREIAAHTGMHVTMIRRYRRAYINAAPEEKDSIKIPILSSNREKEFAEEWIRTVRLIIGDRTIPEHFAEEWTAAVNRIRRFYGLEEQKSEEITTPLIQQRSVPVH